jgi:CRISPR-associated protein Csb2
MVNLGIRFPLGRYHATPWGHHVNEGQVEWPPSPWRVLRALIATGFSKLGWSAPPPEAEGLIDALSSVTPTYRLPPALAFHTRHYMPTDALGPDDRTKIFDAFARVDRESELVISWAVELPKSASALLFDLATKISYLGRAESVAVARVIEDNDLPEGELALPGEVNRPGVEPISLLVPMTKVEYRTWLEQAKPAETQPSSKGKKQGTKDPFPADALAALIVDTSFLQEHGWTQPPGSRRVIYYRRPLATTGIRLPSPLPAAPFADTALLALASDTRRKEVLPRMECALPCTELLHRELLRRVGSDRCPELSGRDDDGHPLEGHQHSVFVPLDLDGDGHLDHVLVHASMGLGFVAQRALRSLRILHTRGLRLFATVVGLGPRSDFLRLGSQGVPELFESQTWESRLPFVPPRHIKSKRHSVEDQVQAELASRGLPRATKIEWFSRPELLGCGFHRFVRARHAPGKAPPASGFFGIRIELERPIAGPLTLGYAAHFGLGLMRPARIVDSSPVDHR